MFTTRLVRTLRAGRVGVLLRLHNYPDATTWDHVELIRVTARTSRKAKQAAARREASSARHQRRAAEEAERAAERAAEDEARRLAAKAAEQRMARTRQQRQRRAANQAAAARRAQRRRAQRRQEFANAAEQLCNDLVAAQLELRRVRELNGIAVELPCLVAAQAPMP